MCTLGHSTGIGSAQTFQNHRKAKRPQEDVGNIQGSDTRRMCGECPHITEYSSTYQIAKVFVYGHGVCHRRSRAVANVESIAQTSELPHMSILWGDGLGTPLFQGGFVSWRRVAAPRSKFLVLPSHRRVYRRCWKPPIYFLRKRTKGCYYGIPSADARVRLEVISATFFPP